LSAWGHFLMFAAVHKSGFGPGLPTLVAARIGNVLGHTGRDPTTATKAARGPRPPSLTSVMCRARQPLLRQRQ
jgi:hypothetical protein